ncbi:DUF2061 domain-containing protein [Arenimonas composti]|nr:DUF2061 domain-containing protein [Arenimonas composti]
MTKTLSFAAVHFTTAFAVGWAMSGSVLVGGALALVEPFCNTIAFHFHEKLWRRLERRRSRRHGEFAHTPL